MNKAKEKVHTSSLEYIMINDKDWIKLSYHLIIQEIILIILNRACFINTDYRASYNGTSNYIWCEIFTVKFLQLQRFSFLVTFHFLRRDKFMHVVRLCCWIFTALILSQNTGTSAFYFVTKSIQMISYIWYHTNDTVCRIELMISMKLEWNNSALIY